MSSLQSPERRSTAYRQVQEIRGKADTPATRVYGEAFSRDPEFYTFLHTLEVYGEKANKNSMMVLTTDSDFYRYVKQAIPESKQRLPVLAPRAAVR